MATLMCIALHVHIHVYCEAVLSILHVLLHTVKLLLLFCDYSIVKVHKFTCTVDAIPDMGPSTLVLVLKYNKYNPLEYLFLYLSTFCLK